jgi:hypothetical protein
MDKRFRNYYWNKLDNAAKIFPAVSTRSNTNVYRLTAKLKEEVNPEALQRALEMSMEQIPIFNVTLTKGYFWYYFEPNYKKPLVTPDNLYPCSFIDKHSNNGFLFRVTYHCKKINLEVFHALTDGTGASLLLEKLLINYLRLLYPDRIPPDLADSEHPSFYPAYDADGFLECEDKSVKRIPRNTKRAYQIKGARLPVGETKAIHLIFSAKQFLSLAKSHNATATAYLGALLIFSIYRESLRQDTQRDPIVLCIPVNLRSFFKSITMHNFFTYIDVSIDFRIKAYTFEEVLRLVSEKLTQSINRESLIARVRGNVEAQNNIAVRSVALFAKNIGLKLLYLRGERSQTTSLSNMGSIKMPAETAPYIDRFELMLSPSPVKPIKTGLCSFGDQMVFSFLSSIEETDIQRRFARHLTKKGIPVRVSCNELPDEMEVELKPDEKLQVLPPDDRQ